MLSFYKTSGPLGELLESLVLKDVCFCIVSFVGLGWDFSFAVLRRPTPQSWIWCKAKFEQHCFRIHSLPECRFSLLNLRTLESISVLCTSGSLSKTYVRINHGALKGHQKKTPRFGSTHWQFSEKLVSGAQHPYFLNLSHYSVWYSMVGYIYIENKCMLWIAIFWFNMLIHIKQILELLLKELRKEISYKSLQIYHQYFFLI